MLPERLYFLLALFWLSLFGVQSAPSHVKIGGIFCEDGDMKEQKAFLLATEFVNNSTAILPNTHLTVAINQTDLLDSFSNIESVYWQIYSGVAAVIGPMTSPMVKATNPICEGFGVPQIAPYATDPSFQFSPEKYPYLLRMSSSDSIENQAIVDFISHFNWTRMALISSRSDYGLNALVTFRDIASHKGWHVVAHESFQEHQNISLINATKQLIHMRGRGAKIIVLSCIAQYVHPILKQARSLGVLKDRVWILTNGAFAHEGLYSPGDEVPDYMQGIVGIRHSFGRGLMSETFKTIWKNSGYAGIAFENEAAVGHTFDSVLVVAQGLQRMFDEGYSLTNTTPQFGIYRSSNTQPRPEGKYLLEYLSKVNSSGVMADRLGFDDERSPLHHEFDIVNLRSYGFDVVAHWNPDERLVMETHKEILWPSGKVIVPSDSSYLLENRTLRVVTVQESPFVYVFSLEQKGKKVEIFEGYCIELLKILSEKLKFTYEVYSVPDGNFGSLDQVSKEWSGMVKEILQGKADIAVASFTISPERQRVVDFTQPFMDLGITALIKSVTEGTDYFSFFKPFHRNLWLAIGLTMIIVGFFLWFFSTFSPYGYYGRCVQTCLSRVPPRYLKYRDTLTLVRAIWSSVVYYVGQSSDHLHPVSSSGRITVAVWWFAILIIMSTYTANLAAFLTIQRFASPITTVDELAKQNRISYGTVTNSQPQAFFQSATIPSFVTMWQFMQSHHAFVKNSKEGIAKVKEGNYAFIWDSAVLEYVAHHQSECGKLSIVGSLLGKIGYGFGLPKDSPYTKQFSSAILELRHSGVMDILERKWIHNSESCSDKTRGKYGATIQDGNQLGFADIAGVFVVVSVGISVSLIVLVLEWVWAGKKDTHIEVNEDGSKQSLMTALQKRRKLAFHDWRHREDIPKVRKHATVIWNTVRPMFPTRREVQVVPSHDSLDEHNAGNLDKVMSITETAEMEIDDEDAESYVV